MLTCTLSLIVIVIAIAISTPACYLYTAMLCLYHCPADQQPATTSHLTAFLLAYYSDAAIVNAQPTALHVLVRFVRHPCKAKTPSGTRLR
jgi:hypothetical protein